MASADTADNADPPTLVATHLTKRFCDRQAVSDVSFQVDRGAAFGLLGPNGAGKTTTVRMLTGLVTPSGGSVSLFGELLTARNADVLRTRIGVQTDTNLYESLSVRDNLVTWGELYGLTSARLARRIDEVLEVLDLTD
ncbi:MAG TPA: ABC transporter ATP-binding protein, partial [Actinotalea sp.]|nr:ABC transporter ATP-binding protein [Actinotalea sp.]